MNNDEYEMKLIDKLSYTFPTGPSHDQWHKLNVQYDAVKRFLLFGS